MMSSKSTRVVQNSKGRRQRRIAKNESEGVLVRSMYPERLTVKADPPEIVHTIRVMKRVQLTQTVTTPFSITPAALALAIPGGLTYWNSFRIERVDVWGTANVDNTLSVSLPAVSAGSQPPVTYVDTGIAGQRRPMVGFRLGLLDRARFFGVADATVLATVNFSSGTSLTIQAVLELSSPA